MNKGELKFGLGAVPTAVHIFVLYKSLFYRETVSNQEVEGEILQKSTGKLISDKDRELETLRNEVLALDFYCMHLQFCIFQAAQRIYLSVPLL